MCAAKKFEGKKIIDLEKELSKTQKDDLYSEKFRQSGKQVKASMKLVASFVLHQVGFVSHVYCKLLLRTEAFQGDSRDLNFISKCLTTADGEKVKVQACISDPPGDYYRSCNTLL